MMLYGLSDRVRYYWPRPAVQAALAKLYAERRRRAAGAGHRRAGYRRTGRPHARDPPTCPTASYAAWWAMWCGNIAAAGETAPLIDTTPDGSLTCRRKLDRRLRVGVLGCGPIAQAAHFESCTKARNADLYAICDVADDLRERMAATHAPEKILRRLRRDAGRSRGRRGDRRDLGRLPRAGGDPRRWRRASMCSARSRSAISVEEVEELREASCGQRQGAAGRPHEALRRRACRRRTPSSTTRWARCWR